MYSLCKSLLRHCDPRPIAIRWVMTHSIQEKETKKIGSQTISLSTTAAACAPSESFQSYVFSFTLVITIRLTKKCKMRHVCHSMIFQNSVLFAALVCQDVTRLNYPVLTPDPGMYGTYLIAKDQLYLDKACRVNLANWLVENGWNASFCSSSFDTHGNELLEDIRNKVKSFNEIWKARILPKVESEAQSIVADIRIYEGILMNVPAVIYCFLAGVNNNKMTKIVLRGRQTCKKLLKLPSIQIHFTQISALAHMHNPKTSTRKLPKLEDTRVVAS